MKAFKFRFGRFYRITVEGSKKSLVVKIVTKPKLSKYAKLLYNGLYHWDKPRAKAYIDYLEGILGKTVKIEELEKSLAKTLYESADIL